jgi:hypothetical protein
VAHICNLVQEFNGLVSKGPVVILALLLLNSCCSAVAFLYALHSLNISSVAIILFSAC